jgi:hypothetical protein
LVGSWVESLRRQGDVKIYSTWRHLWQWIASCLMGRNECYMYNVCKVSFSQHLYGTCAVLWSNWCIRAGGTFWCYIWISVLTTISLADTYFILIIRSIYIYYITILHFISNFNWFFSMIAMVDFSLFAFYSMKSLFHIQLLDWNCNALNKVFHFGILVFTLWFSDALSSYFFM